MSGIFAEWQPRYAERGVATFPVANKRPCVRHWQNVGANGSSQLAMKFADADAFGFQCGRRNGITLVDIDSRDERVVGEAIQPFGGIPRSFGALAAATMPCPSATTARSGVFAWYQGCP